MTDALTKLPAQRVGAAGAGSGHSPLSTRFLPDSGVSRATETPALSWPPSREELAELIKTRTQEEIGAMYGVQRAAVSKLAKRLGIEWPHEGRYRLVKRDAPLSWPLSRTQLEQLLSEGKSTADICKLVGRAKGVVLRLRSKYGLHAAHPRGKRVGTKADRAWNPHPAPIPARTSGKFETVEEWLAAGNQPTKCPDRYLMPVVSGTPAYSSARRNGL